MATNRAQIYIAAVDQTKSAFDSLRRNLGSIEGQARIVSSTLQSLGTALAAAFAGNQLTRFVGESVRVFADFDDKMRQAAAASGATGRELEQLRELAKRMGEQTRFSASQAADGLKALSLSGMSVKEQIKALPAVLQLAAAGSVSLEEAASIATNAIAQFGLSAGDLAAVNDVLVKAFTSSNTNVKDLGLALQYVGPIANAAGNSFRDTATALAILANNGFSGEKAGTALRGVLAALLNPSREVAAALAAAGVQVKDASGQLLPLVEIMRRFREAGVTTSRMMEIFGTEAAPAMIAAVATSRDKFDELVAAMGHYVGKAGQVAGQMEAGIGGALRNLASAWEGVKIAAAEAVTARDSSAVASLTRTLTEHKDTIAAVAAEWGHLGARAVEAGVSAARAITDFANTLRGGTTQLASFQGVGEAVVAVLKTIALGAVTAAAMVRNFAATLGVWAAAGKEAITGNLELAGNILAAQREDLRTEMEQLSSYYNRLFAEVPRAAAQVPEAVSRMMRTVSEQSGMAFGSVREMTAAIRDGAVEVDLLTGKWRLSAKAAEEYRAGVERVAKPLGSGADQQREERLALARAQAEAELGVLKSRIAREDAELDRQLERHLISRQEYHARKSTLEQQEIDAEIGRVQESIRRQQEIVRQAAAGGLHGEELKTKAEIARLEGELIALNNRRADAAVANAHKAAAAERELRDELAGIREELLELTGTATHDDRVAALERQYRGLRERLRAEGDAEGESLLSRFIGVKAAAADLSAYERQYSSTLSMMHSQEQTLQTQRQAGLLTESQLRRQVIDLHQATAAELERLLPMMEASANAIGSPEQLSRVAMMRAEIARLKLVIDDVAVAIDGAVQDAFGQLFEDLGRGAKSAREAFLEFARSVLSAINRIASQRLAEALFGELAGGGFSLGRLISGLMGTAPAGFATGGYVTGPGTATSDSIPARLSHGEYVLNASAVRAWGVEFLDFLNGLGRVALHGPRWSGPSLAFAGGGYVPDLPAREERQGGGPGVRIVNVVDPTLARDFLTSSNGEEVILNILRRNAGSVRQLLR